MTVRQVSNLSEPFRVSPTHDYSAMWQKTGHDSQPAQGQILLESVLG